MDSGIVARLQTAEEFYGGVNVASYLVTQEFGRIESSLVADAFQKLQPAACRHFRHDALKYEGLDSLLALAEGRASADVGDGIRVTACIQLRPCDVYALLRKDCILSLQIQRRNCDLASAAGARNDVAFNFKPSSEHPARL